MPTSYPSGLDSFTNPTASDTLNSGTVPHAAQHANVNDAVEAIQAELGTLPKGGSATVKARLDGVDSSISTTNTNVTNLDNATKGGRLLGFAQVTHASSNTYYSTNSTSLVEMTTALRVTVTVPSNGLVNCIWRASISCSSASGIWYGGLYNVTAAGFRAEENLLGHQPNYAGVSYATTSVYSRQLSLSANSSITLSPAWKGNTTYTFYALYGPSYGAIQFEIWSLP